MKKPRCSRCGRALSDPYSIAVGMGPECRGLAKKRGVKFPKAKWRVSGGRVVFDGLDGKAAPLPTSPKNEERVFRGGKKEKDEKRELVLRARRAGRTLREATNLLRDYMMEKDSRVNLKWCIKFAYEVWMEE